MTKNVGEGERALRALAAVGSTLAAFVAPFSLPVRASVFGLLAAYLLWTAVAGTCAGYRLMGKSTCRAARS